MIGTSACVRCMRIWVFLVQQLHHLKGISTLNLDDLVKAIACDTENAECMYGECSVWKKDLSCPVSSEYNAENQVFYLQWAIVDKKHKNDPNGKTSNTTVKERVPVHARTAGTAEPAAA